MQRLKFRKEHRHAPSEVTLHPLSAERVRRVGDCAHCYDRPAAWTLLAPVVFGGLGEGDPFAGVTMHTPLCEPCAAKFRAAAESVVDDEPRAPSTGEG